jgi:hypothetical protein
VAAPRDIELEGYSFLNSGFIAVKNKPEGLHILETIFTHPDYREYDNKNWWEQSELSHYLEKYPDQVMVLPLNDFNTPCGRIVRHCWIKHILEPMVIEEVFATFTKLTLHMLSQNKQVNLGTNIQFFLS